MKFKRVLLILIILYTSLTYAASKSFISADMIRAGEPVIGKTIPFRTFNGFHNSKITNIDLNDYKGKWIILFFYPSDFSFVCPTELKEMSDYYSDFK